jgi:hypothetical protein
VDGVKAWIARAMGVDATVKGWIALEEQCSTLHVPFATLFAEWLQQQEAGSRFGAFGDSSEEEFEEQMQFVGRHVQGQSGNALSMACLPSYSSEGAEGICKCTTPGRGSDSVASKRKWAIARGRRGRG